ncbi:MAG: septal ring lytic transglycosylase RlpA family protein [Chlorobi bacterium]|nr:septal ring lytic transglycosylase RlpA family protein [Chlorobiota bacterium]
MTAPPDGTLKTGTRMRGMASYYHDEFHGRRTASGEIFQQHHLTAAHQTLPLGTLVRVVNLKNGRSVVVRINDRGPFVGGRILDVSRAAAEKLGMLADGLANVEMIILDLPP